VASLPTALILVLADDPTYLRSHHDAPILPLLGLAAVEGLAALRGGWRAPLLTLSARGSWRLRAGVGVLVAAALLAYLLNSRMPGGGNTYVAQLTRWDALSSAMQRAVAATPPGGTLAGTTNAIVHLADRDYAKIYPFKYARVLKPKPRQVDWWVIDLTNQRTRGFVDDRDSPLHADPPYGLWLLDDQVLVASDHLPLPAQPAPPGAEFGGALRLDRFDARPTAEGLNVRLAWTVLRPLPANARSALVAISINQDELASRQGPVGVDYAPPSEWQPGQTVIEDVLLTLEPGYGPAASLRVSWGSADTGEALVLPDGSDTLELPAGSQ